MKRSDENIDELIREALSEEDAKFYKEVNEPSMFELLGDLFRSRRKWLFMWGVLMTLIFLAICIYCGIRFYYATDVHDMLLWGAGAFAALIVQSMIKIWSWMQLDKNHLLREIKRLELQVAVLAGKVGEKQNMD